MKKPAKIVRLHSSPPPKPSNKKARPEDVSRLEAELEYKATKLLEALDEANQRIESLERTQRYLIHLLKDIIQDA